MITYQEALTYIHGTLRFGSKPGLDRIKRLLEFMGNPQNGLKFIHIAGTNGKGSSANAVASCLTQAGYKTGLYTSPYITDFCERIKIDGEFISHSALAAATEIIMPLAEKAAENGDNPTEFEIITALALKYFKDCGCDAVVLEVGLGGRFDATNIIKRPEVAVITSISYDHTDILGDTLAKIAFEKCGIIKDGGTVVTSSGQNAEALEVIMRVCAERGAELVMPGVSSVKILKADLDGTDIMYGASKLHIPLAGRHQITNFITAYEALCVLRRCGFDISDEDIAEGMSKVVFPARMEILSRSPLVVLDGAHNPSGAAALADSIKGYLELGKKPPVLIMGMLADKDYKSAISALAPLAVALVAVRPDSPRALDPVKTAKEAENYCPLCEYYEDYDKAFEEAMLLADGSPVVICGSLYLAGRMREVVNKYFENPHS